MNNNMQSQNHTMNMGTMIHNQNKRIELYVSDVDQHNRDNFLKIDQQSQTDLTEQDQ